MEDLNPKSNSYLLGQDEAQKIFLDAWKNNSLHNSWLISGVSGIGKATFAYKVARFLLSVDETKKQNYDNLDINGEQTVFRQVANASHPDLKIIERGYSETDKRKIIKAIKDGKPLEEEDLKEFKKSTNIKIDEVREIKEFLSKKSADGNWRIVIVDSVDEMNIASANAILKVLEEPPHKTIMLLISHNPNKLLPTIKSRCAKLALKPLEENEVASLLRRYRPEVTEKDVKEAAKLSGGSIGRAISYVDFDALALYESLCKIVYAKSNFQIEDLLNFCNKATAGEEEYNLAKELVLKFISENVLNSPALTEVWDTTLETFSETDRLNMDKKQALTKVIINISKVI